MRAFFLTLVPLLACWGQAGQAWAKDSPFHTHAEINARLEALAKEHPDWVSLHEVATVEGGRAVLAIELDTDGTLDDDEPVLLVHGGVHGNEWGSVEVVLHLAELSVALGPKALGPLRMHFVPVVNAGGYDRGERKVRDKEGKPYDANRNFPVPGRADKGSRPLVQAFRRYAERGRLAGVLDYHNPAESITWPYAYHATQQPNGVKELEKVAREMARAVGYQAGQTARVIGYKHAGTAQDYFASRYGVPALLVELGWIKGPEVDSIPQELVEQERPFLIFVEWLKGRASSR